MTKAIRPPVKWHGGKYYLASKIISLFPKHETYVEPFGGAASVLLNKPPSNVEVYNDLDHRITRLFTVLRDHGAELQRLLTLTPYSEVEFTASCKNNQEFNDIELARRDFVTWRQSMGGRGESFSYTKHRIRRGMADVVSGYLSAIDEEMPRIVERLRTVQIVERSALDIIRHWDDKATLFYCDPPYLPETRNKKHTDIYGVEMTKDDHRDLGELLKTCVGKVIVSGYPSDLYTSMFGDWHTVSIDMPNHAAGGVEKARTEEVLWLNWKPGEEGDGLFALSK